MLKPCCTKKVGSHCTKPKISVLIMISATDPTTMLGNKDGVKSELRLNGGIGVAGWGGGSGAAAAASFSTPRRSGSALPVPAAAAGSGWGRDKTRGGRGRETTTSGRQP